MFTRSLALVLFGWASFATAELGFHLKPSLGESTPEDFESVVAPDGSGLPPGEGTVLGGKAIYMTHCMACHGLDGRQAGNAIVGGRGTLATSRPIKTVGSFWPYATTLFDYINRAMPYGNEKSLSANQIYAVTAYVLHLNDIVSADTTLTQENLPGVLMPNRDGFHMSPDYQPITTDGW